MLKRTQFEGLLLAALLLVLLPGTYQFSADGAKDGSWMRALNYAVAQGMRFGQDWQFTYGPLGFVSTRCLYGLPNWSLIGFDLIWSVSLIYALSGVLRLLRGGGAGGYVGLVGAVAALGGYAEAAPLFFLLVLLLLVLYHRTGRPQALWLALFWTGIVFLVKLNFGLIVGVVSGAVTLSVAASDRRWGLAVGSLLGFAGWVLVLCWWWSVDLAGYVASGWRMISSYNESMAYMALNRKRLFLLTPGVLFLVGLLLVLFARALLRRPFDVRRAVWLGVFSGVYYVVYKQAFTRLDGGHAAAFFLFIPTLAGLVNLAKILRPREGKLLAGASLLVGWLGATGLTDGNPLALPYRDLLFAGSIESRLPELAAEQEARLDSDLCQYLGKRSVDILPEDCIYPLTNGFNFRPRPVVQSYAAHHDAFMRANEQYFLGNNAPDFVFFAVKPTAADATSNPTWQDTYAQLALRSRYDLDTSAVTPRGDTLLLLQRRAVAHRPEIHPIHTQRLRFGQALSIPPGEGVALLRADLRYSLWGRLRSVLFQAPVLRVLVTQNDGRRAEFILPKPILESGILLTRTFNSSAEARRFFHPSLPLRRIAHLELRGDPAGFAEEATVRLVEYRLH